MSAVVQWGEEFAGPKERNCEMASAFEFSSETVDGMTRVISTNGGSFPATAFQQVLSSKHVISREDEPFQGFHVPLDAPSAAPSGTASEASPDASTGARSVLWHAPVDQTGFQYYPSIDTPGWPVVADKKKLTYLTLVNGTPYNFTLRSARSKRMKRFQFQGVESGTAQQNVQEYRAGLMNRWEDNEGTAIYGLEGSECGEDGSIQVKATAKGLFDMAETYAIGDLPMSRGETASSGSFKVDARGGSRAYNLVITGSEKLGRYYTSMNPPIAWMHEILDVIGDRKLKHVCMLGSHDAGISKIDGGTAFADWRNSQSQWLDIYGQLNAGSRYFDIRPVIANGGKYMTGHYNLPSDVPLGVNGQTIEEIVGNVNKFTAENPELVILRLTHAYNTDDGYRGLKDAEWDGVFDRLEKLEKRCSGLKGDITNLTMNDLIGNGQACVIIVTNGGQARPDSGIYSESSFPVVDHWSDTDSAEKMAEDQLKHLSESRHLSPDATKDTFLIFQWLLTLEVLENVSISDWVSIESLAVRLAYDPLFWKAWNEFTPEKYPSVILMDYIGLLQQGEEHRDDGKAGRNGGAEVRALVMAVNLAIASANTFVGGGSIY
ncbi:hypothetical protein KEM55_004175 [Ascosphaera atra]|nr:hypothetical protein KEM55_004175 [Ascosphaera atra]